MNILLYVITVLMLLSTMTYARWENFRSFMGLQRGFVHYMGAIEQTSINKSSANWYGNIVVKPKDGKKIPKKGSERNGAVGRLSFHLLLQEKERGKYDSEYQQIRSLAKRLMKVLYGETRFFKEIAAKRPNFIDDILDEIQKASANLEKKDFVKETAGLLNLEFSDPELHHAFYLMMRGNPINIEQPPEPSLTFIEPVEEIDIDDEEDHAGESAEAHASLGYVSLMDSITIKPSKNMIRVFLAPRPLLMAIFGDGSTVDNIIEKRTELYKELKRNSKDNTTPISKQLGESFKNEFSQSGYAPEYHSILDFAVTKTDPRKYE